VRLARAFAERRRARGADTARCRLYVAEASPTVTGAMADERLALAPSGLAHLASLLSQAVATGGVLRPQDVRFEPHPHPFPEREGEVFGWVAAAARDLLQHRGRALVLVGDGEPPIVHALAHALNHDALGGAGATLDYGEPVELEPADQTADLAALVADMRAGKVELLAILGGNPVYEAPAELDFGGALERVPLRLHLGLFADETAERCHWHVPEAHFLEAWGDARAFDGTVSIVQPLIAPLYGGRSALELVAVLDGRIGAQGYELVRERWREHLSAGGDFETGWRRALHDGVVAGTGQPPLPLPLARREIDWPDAGGFARMPLELSLAPDPSVHDGRFANNAWLQELPRPLSKLTWDNAALLAPGTAARLGIASGDVVRLAVEGRALEAPTWIQPGQAPDCVTLHLGYGRTRAGGVGTGVGVDAYRLRGLAVGGAVSLERTGKQHAFAVTQEHHSMEGRDLARETTFAAFRAGDTGAPAHHHAAPGDTSLYPGFAYEGHAWGLAIDLDACIGCNACVVACQAENNIPVVGKEEVRRGREMHWIRIDRYFKGAAAAPLVRFQPVTCMHCENAPCEVVCPVGATVHGPEGLNEMVYNRCIGTRYCSNNCPYKVRRFNFYKYTDDTTESLKLLRNPDVTVRSRGVMEKCTYCVQRISQARIAAKKAERPLRGSEIVTACQQVCPARAITFGDVNDDTGELAALRSEPRHYALLGELNTRPRTTYLARITHPNPELHAEAASEKGSGH
jgi:molybdopterin-containing oxidoreductase family iron-sulfur binding subunit